MTGYVYVMGSHPGQPVKIGYSADPEQRLAAVSILTPYLIEVLAAVPGSPADEASVHKLLAAARLRGEWFAWTPAVADVIAQMREGRPMADILPAPFSRRTRVSLMDMDHIRRVLLPLRDAEDEAKRKAFREIERYSGFARHGVRNGLDRPDWMPRADYGLRLWEAVKHYEATGEVPSPTATPEAAA